MNLFELSTLLSPLGGAFGAALAVYRPVPSASGWWWSDEDLTNGEKVENLKWLNEIMHRVTMLSETDSWEDIKHWGSRSPDIGPHIEWALKLSYDSCHR